MGMRICTPITSMKVEITDGINNIKISDMTEETKKAMDDAFDIIADLMEHPLGLLMQWEKRFLLNLILLSRLLKSSEFNLVISIRPGLPTALLFG